ncbi:MAG TPA: type II toxin-antitoxin system antitoxin SocA domain-containing protein [Longimicrobium sp.]|nr:type II toxin-antitoxin system antitoxin SocA domain-containing protein [Longimicrobium sp.]
MYYAQAWHLGRYGERLFPEKFQAWSTGPVIPALYWKYKPWGIRHIAGDREPPALYGRVARLLNDVADEYMWMDEYDLADLAYRESPWIKARGGIDIAEPCETELDENDMLAFFQHLAEAA